MQVPLHIELRLLDELVALQQEGKIGIVLAEGGHYYIGEMPDPWGSKVGYTVTELLALVTLHKRKGPGREQEQGQEWQNERLSS